MLSDWSSLWRSLAPPPPQSLGVAIQLLKLLLFAQLSAVLGSLGGQSSSSSAGEAGSSVTPLGQVIPLLVLIVLYWAYIRWAVPMADLWDLVAEVRAAGAGRRRCWRWLRAADCSLRCQGAVRLWAPVGGCKRTPHHPSSRTLLLPPRPFPALATLARWHAASSAPACPPPPSCSCECSMLGRRLAWGAAGGLPYISNASAHLEHLPCSLLPLLPGPCRDRLGVAMLTFQAMALLTAMIPNTARFLVSWCQLAIRRVRGPAPADRFAAVVMQAMSKVRWPDLSCSFLTKTCCVCWHGWAGTARGSA